MEIAIKVVNENTRETVQRETFDNQDDAGDFVEELIAGYHEQGWIGGFLHETTADAMLMRGAPGGEVYAVHVYEERD